jgi:transaldolase
MTKNAYKSPLHQTVMTTVTDYWNDSCALDELTYAIEHGAVGATTNPTIVGEVYKKEINVWRDRVKTLLAENSVATEDEITWKLIEEMAVRGAKLLQPIYERHHGLKGRLSIQTNPIFYRDSDRLVEQAIHFSTLAPNMQVKMPVTKAGVRAIEEATYRGVNINATVSFSVPQALAVGEAMERGLQRRTAEGLRIDDMAPVVTLMIGRLDDWMHIVCKRDGIAMTPGYNDWAGIACLKKAYGLFQERGYRPRLLAAAYRHHLHWSELIGGNIVLSMPSAWQKLFNASDIEVKERFADPVAPHIVETLYRLIPDFRHAYDADGQTPDDFDTFGPAARTLRSFIGSYRDLTAMVREVMLPNPDVK